MLLLVAATVLGSSLAAANAADAAVLGSCGSGYTRLDTVTFDGGKLVIYRNGKTWCALTRRTGSLYGHRGPTYVRLSDARQPDAVDSGNYLYYAGPVRLQHKQPPLDEYCIIAFGFVELGSHHAQGAKRYCFQYA